MSSSKFTIELRDPGFTDHVVVYIPTPYNTLAVVLPDLDDEDCVAQVYALPLTAMDNDTWMFDIASKTSLLAFLELFSNDWEQNELIVKTSLLRD